MSSNTTTVSIESRVVLFAFANTVWYMLTIYQNQKAKNKKNKSSKSSSNIRDSPISIKSTELHTSTPAPTPTPTPSSSSSSSSSLVLSKDIKGREIDGFSIDSIRLYDIPTLRDQFNSSNNSIAHSFSYNKVITIITIITIIIIIIIIITIIIIVITIILSLP